MILDSSLRPRVLAGFIRTILTRREMIDLTHAIQLFNCQTNLCAVGYEVRI